MLNGSQKTLEFSANPDIQYQLTERGEIFRNSRLHREPFEFSGRFRPDDIITLVEESISVASVRQ